jgi:hypothetical protein
VWNGQHWTRTNQLLKYTVVQRPFGLAAEVVLLRGTETAQLHPCVQLAETATDLIVTF